MPVQALRLCNTLLNLFTCPLETRRPLQRAFARKPQNTVARYGRIRPLPQSGNTSNALPLRQRQPYFPDMRYLYRFILQESWLTAAFHSSLYILNTQNLGFFLTALKKNCDVRNLCTTSEYDESYQKTEAHEDEGAQ